MNEIQIEKAVCIVGAGPAGAAASLFLAQNGVKHILLDKAVFPRDKVCGDALTMEVMHTFNKINPAFVQELYQQTDMFLPSWGIKGYAPNGNALTINFSQQLPYAPFYTVKRFDFDNFLLQKLDTRYVDFHAGVQINTISREKDKIVTRFSSGTQQYAVTSSLIFGADGATSTVARFLSDAKRKDLSHTSASIRTYFSGVSGDNLHNELEFYFFKTLLPGYFWIFPMPNGEFNVGVIIKSDSKSTQAKYLRKHFAELIAQHPVLKKRFAGAQQLAEPEGWMLPLNSAKKQLAGDNYLLLGDAGSLVEPFSGKGIGIAMVSGKIAVEFALRALDKGRFDAGTLYEYHNALYERYKWEWYLSKKFQDWYESERFVNTFTAAYNLPGVQRLTERYVNKWTARWMQ